LFGKLTPNDKRRIRTRGKNALSYWKAHRSTIPDIADKVVDGVHKVTSAPRTDNVCGRLKVELPRLIVERLDPEAVAIIESAAAMPYSAIGREVKPLWIELALVHILTKKFKIGPLYIGDVYKKIQREAVVSEFAYIEGPRVVKLEHEPIPGILDDTDASYEPSSDSSYQDPNSIQRKRYNMRTPR
jgi:hypothetical protein